MTTKFDGDSTISSRDVMERIAELEESVNDLGYRVVRDSDGETIATFTDEDEAEAYIEDEDYDPAKVSVEPDEPDEDDAEELQELQEFERDCRNAFGSYEWNSGLTLRDGDSVDDDFARDYYVGNYGEPDGNLGDFVNWDAYAQDLTGGRDYAELNGNYYYDI